MNKKGFTIMELLATIVILAMIMMMIFPSITKLLKNNDEKKYQTYEDMMVEYAIVSEVAPVNNIIKLSQLDELADVKRECTGYVKVIDRTKNQYKAYILCGDNVEDCNGDYSEDYKTDGFSCDYAG